MAAVKPRFERLRRAAEHLNAIEQAEQEAARKVQEAVNALQYAEVALNRILSACEILQRMDEHRQEAEPALVKVSAMHAAVAGAAIVLDHTIVLAKVPDVKLAMEQLEACFRERGVKALAGGD